MTPTSAPLRIVDRYALFDVIATGGMASVHLGRLMGPVGFTRTVAIKRLHENFARDPEFVAMFLNEARLVARIRHSNVVQTLDVVASAQELLLVMEYVLGESLAELIRRARKARRLIPIPIVVDIVTGLLNGLHAAHEATNEQGEPLNVVHRDVSPHNVLVGVDGVTRVLDFGIAQAIGHMHQSRPGQVQGKIRYMPPEQFSGKDVGRAADIYAASVVLWEALACSRLFGSGTDAEIIGRVLEGKIPPPSQVRSDVSCALQEIVLRGLRRDPAERYQTAKDMANALEGAASPVTRNTVSNWVLESAGDDIEQRRQCLARVESSITPASPSWPPPSSPPSVQPPAVDSTPSSVASLSHSLAPDSRSESVRWPHRKRLVLMAGATIVLALVGLTPPLLLRSSHVAHEPTTPSSDSAKPSTGKAAAKPAPTPAINPAHAATTTSSPLAASPVVAASSVAASTAPSAPKPVASASASSPRMRVTPATTAKWQGAKGGFDRIYRRD